MYKLNFAVVKSNANLSIFVCDYDTTFDAGNFAIYYGINCLEIDKQDIKDAQHAQCALYAGRLLIVNYYKK